MLVEVRPISVKPWHGKEGKESFTQPKTIEVLFDATTGKYATGLTDEEAVKYGDILGVDLSNRFGSEPHPYWSTQAARIKLPNHTIILDDEKPIDFVKIKNLKASMYVANSMKALEAGDFPYATHVIYDESEEVQVNATKIQRRNKCIKVLSGLSSDQKIQLVQILGEKSVKGRSADFIDVEMDKIINDKPNEFLRYAEMDKQEVYTRATILEAIQKNVIIKEGNALHYMGDRIANDYEDSIQWFLDPQNSKHKVAILEKINK